MYRPPRTTANGRPRTTDNINLHLSRRHSSTYQSPTPSLSAATAPHNTPAPDPPQTNPTKYIFSGRVDKAVRKAWKANRHRIASSITQSQPDIIDLFLALVGFRDISSSTRECRRRPCIFVTVGRGADKDRVYHSIRDAISAATEEEEEGADALAGVAVVVSHRSIWSSSSDTTVYTED